MGGSKFQRRVENFARAQDHGAGQEVFQLADVSGPVVIHQLPHGRFGDAMDTAPELPRQDLDEVSRQSRNVLAALAQRR